MLDPLGRSAALEDDGPSLDDLVRPLQQRPGDRQAEGPGGLEVDDQLKPVNPLNRQSIEASRRNPNQHRSPSGILGSIGNISTLRRRSPRPWARPRDIVSQSRPPAAPGADGTVSELREIDLVRAGPIQLTVSADLGADILQEVSSFGRQTEMNRRWRGLDEAGLYKSPHRNRSLGVLWNLTREPAPASPAVLNLQQHFEPVELLTKVPRVTEKITHGAPHCASIPTTVRCV
jgi:hypothetical protein